MSEDKNPKSILSQIEFKVRQRLDKRKRIASLNGIQSRLKEIDRIPVSLSQAILNAPTKYPIIAEVKRASPSQGAIAMDANPIDIAAQYLNNQASAISVLTEEDFFQGSLKYLEQIKLHHQDACILQKDFLVDDYQLFEAKMLGADAILIIMKLTGPEKARDLFQLAKELSLSALVEIHNEKELRWALDIDAEIIGINSRDLKNFSVSHDGIIDLAKHIPSEKIIIAESGIKQTNDLKLLAHAGCHGFLVGTQLMQEKKPGIALRNLIHG